MKEIELFPTENAKLAMIELKNNVDKASSLEEKIEADIRFEYNRSLFMMNQLKAYLDCARDEIVELAPDHDEVPIAEILSELASDIVEQRKTIEKLRFTYDYIKGYNDK